MLFPERTIVVSRDADSPLCYRFIAEHTSLDVAIDRASALSVCDEVANNFLWCFIAPATVTLHPPTTICSVTERVFIDFLKAHSSLKCLQARLVPFGFLCSECGHVPPRRRSLVGFHKTHS